MYSTTSNGMRNHVSNITMTYTIHFLKCCTCTHNKMPLVHDSLCISYACSPHCPPHLPSVWYPPASSSSFSPRCTTLSMFCLITPLTWCLIICISYILMVMFIYVTIQSCCECNTPQTITIFDNYLRFLPDFIGKLLPRLVKTVWGLPSTHSAWQILAKKML